MPSESQVYNTDTCTCDSVPSVSSSKVNSPEYSCPTPPTIDYSFDEDSILLMAEFSGDSDGSQHSALTVSNESPGPSATINIPSTTASSSSNVKSTVVTKSANLSVKPTIPNDIAQTAAFPSVRPVNVKFPLTKFGTTTRAFYIALYDRFHWLEYSVQHDTCYCYPCHIFGTSSSYSRSRPEHAFTVTGFCNWKKANGKDGVLNCHANTVSHQQAEVAWHQYKYNTVHGTSISDRINSARSVTIAQNRHYLKTILEILMFCGHQEIALHGHREGRDSSNRGNFLELLQLVGKHDGVIQQ